MIGFNVTSGIVACKAGKALGMEDMNWFNAGTAKGLGSAVVGDTLCTFDSELFKGIETVEDTEDMNLFKAETSNKVASELPVNF